MKNKNGCASCITKNCSKQENSCNCDSSCGCQNQDSVACSKLDCCKGGAKSKEKIDVIISQKVGDNDHYKYVQNFECPFFPCHEEIDLDDFNCLFCYCPLYMLGKDCGGNFRIIDENIKDCSNCSIPHRISKRDFIQKKLVENVIPLTALKMKNKKDH
ncbi:cysteine-rich small domain-containing protein [Mycoplasma sp. (ex Biomphalaria glabrata)]|uniref:cysteine-rich small domain-containing protein n=1 Tax=Mycoplasma sp. (ex Biomphalaria glabrata) TaxID=1749074 RepID=UPI000A12282A|nr:cysteine-rich small domain-containing protein [Mycoplasma sp. (ex Biomphalaria glabrata)]